MDWTKDDDGELVVPLMPDHFPLGVDMTARIGTACRLLIEIATADTEAGMVRLTKETARDLLVVLQDHAFMAADQDVFCNISPVARRFFEALLTARLDDRKVDDDG